MKKNLFISLFIAIIFFPAPMLGYYERASALPCAAYSDAVQDITPTDVEALEETVSRLVNKERAKRGLGPLIFNKELCHVARRKSQDMIDFKYFSHISPTYGSAFDMVESFGIKFSAGGENIAQGQKTAEAVMKSWMRSSGHRANILSPAYNQLGVGVAVSANGNIIWTQIFIRSR